MFVTFSSNNQTLEIEGDVFFHYDDGGLIGVSFKVKGADKPEMYQSNGLWRISETSPDPPTQFDEPPLGIPIESIPDLVGYENMDYTIGAHNHVNKDKEIPEDFYPDRNF